MPAGASKKLKKCGGLLLLILLAGCQALAGSDTSATLAVELAGFETQSARLRQTAVSEQTQVVATLGAANTQISAAVLVNLALGATVRANVTATPAMRAAVVSAADMGSSREGEMMDGQEGDAFGFGAMTVGNIEMARRLNASTGCSAGAVGQFGGGDERIYVTAQVAELQAGTAFGVDWVYENRVVYRSGWTADYSAGFECIWFYVTPQDFAFLPGTYTVTLFVDGSPLPAVQFLMDAS